MSSGERKILDAAEGLVIAPNSPHASPKAHCVRHDFQSSIRKGARSSGASALRVIACDWQQSAKRASYLPGEPLGIRLVHMIASSRLAAEL